MLRKLVSAGLLLTLPLAAQTWHNNSALQWQTFETAHFRIHFHAETERSAREVVTVAEKIYGPITRLYGYEPPFKTDIIVKDVDDVSNGLAYYYDNKIEIWARPLDFDLRGSHRWMQDVVTHEFVHIVQMGTALKFGRQVPGFYLQLLTYEDEKRDDVLYGYPIGLASYPLPGANLPPWFAEGVAQYMYAGAGYDTWDSHRDMLLRDRVWHDNLLSFGAMNTFGKSGIGNESAYNQGYAFVSWLAGRFGPDVLQQISRAMSAPGAVSISRAIGKVTGSTGQGLYNEWKQSLVLDTRQKMGRVLRQPAAGELVAAEGVANLQPVWHPHQRRFAYLSNRGADFFGQTALFIHDLETGLEVRVARQAIGAAAWSADGEQLYYAGRSKPNRDGARWYDLFVYTVASAKSRRLTVGERATSPVPLDSLTLAYLTVHDGSSNVRLLSLADGTIRNLTALDDGTYMHSLAFSPGDSLLIADVTRNHGRELLVVNLADGTVRDLPPQPGLGGDLRDPQRAGEGLIISTDASGVFNLYRSGGNGGGTAGYTEGYLTNVIGGAFMPSVNGHGELLYAEYRDGGYRIALLAAPLVIPSDSIGIASDHWRDRPASPQEAPDLQAEAIPYEEVMSKLFFLPRLVLDYGTLKPGFFVYANEVLDRMSLFAGVSVNRRGDADYFLSSEFRKFRPTLYAQVYAARRHVTQAFEYYDYQGDNNLRFDLLEGTIGARQSVLGQRLWMELVHSRYRVQIDQTLEGQQAGGFSYEYYVGTALVARWQYSTRRPEYGGNMFPLHGSELEAELRTEWNGLADSLSISRFGTIVPRLRPHNTVRLTLSARKFLPLWAARRIGLAYEGRLGWLSNTGVDDFFYFFGGGPPGLRGYTFYDSTAQGTNLMIHTLTLRLPIFIEQSLPLGQLTFQNASIGVVLQIGDGFNGSWVDHRYRKSAGLEFRLSGYNFYVFPFAISYELHRPVGRDRGGWRHMFNWLFDF